MNKTFTSASFDLSSTPDVVWALPPTVGASLHNVAFTLRTLKGLDRLTLLANLSTHHIKKRYGTINSYWGVQKTNPQFWGETAT
jgi:hypothetical protein